MSNFGGYKIFRPRLTRYCRGCVPGGIDAPAFAHPSFSAPQHLDPRAFGAQPSAAVSKILNRPLSARLCSVAVQLSGLGD